MAAASSSGQAMGSGRSLDKLLHDDSLMQLGVALGCLVLAWGISALVRRLTRDRKAKDTEPHAGWRVLTPLLLFLFLSLSYVIAGRVHETQQMLALFSQLTLLWLAVRLLPLFTRGHAAHWWLAGLTIPMFLLYQMGLFIPLVAYLDSLSFSVGAVEISVYRAIKSALLIGVLLFVTKALLWQGESAIRKIPRVRASNRQLLIKAFQIVSSFIVFLIGLTILGIDLSALAIFSGAVGVGVGFGLQKVASNFISGLILLFEKSVEPDDLVELENGTYGYVRHTRARYTLLETFDGKEIMIPNEDFITNSVVNWTYTNSKGRVEVPIGVSYNSDIEKAQTIILQAARQHPRCSAEPEPVCYLREFADSSVNFLLFFWVEDVTEGRYLPQSEVMLHIWKEFHAQGIEIPYPQQDVYVKAWPEGRPALEKDDA